METIEPIVNRVANSDLVTIYLAELLPKIHIQEIDIAQWLHAQFILREADFRKYVAEHDWTQYAGCYLSVTCSTDAIIPDWAFMLISVAASPYANKVVQGSKEATEVLAIEDAIQTLDLEPYRNKKILIKGCGSKVPLNAVVRITQLLRPMVSSLMYGEACSNVPLFKQAKA